RRLMFDEKLATSVQASNDADAIAGRFVIAVSLVPGADRAKAEAILEDELRSLLRRGPTRAETEKMRIGLTRRAIDLVDKASDKATLLATGELFAGDPGAWRTSFVRSGALAPRAIADAARPWLDAGSFTLLVEPFPDLSASSPSADRSVMPEATPVADAAAPAFERFALSNGLPVILAERHDVPKVTLQMSVRTGNDPDYKSRVPGTTGLGVKLLDDGTLRLSGDKLAEEIDRIGAKLGIATTGEETVISISALSARFDPACAIWADVARNPAFRDEDVARERSAFGARLAADLSDPAELATVALQLKLWGEESPYGILATPQSIARISRGDLVAWHKRWFGPNNAQIVVVGDITAAELKPRLEAAFASWAPAPGSPMEVPDVARPTAPIIYLLDAPGVSQSEIRVATVASRFDPRTEPAEDFLNSILGGGFNSRLNLNLREAKGWSYGVSSAFGPNLGQRIYAVLAPVQTDATAEAMLEIHREIADITGGRLPSGRELEAVRREALFALVSRWESRDTLAGDLASLRRYNLPADYWARYAADLRSVTADDVRAAGKRLLSDDKLVWVVVGDLSKIEAGIRSLGFGDVKVIDRSGKVIR
ncbi:MAG: insulinase family protein, partial [Sphingopyxis sp.]